MTPELQLAHLGGSLCRLTAQFFSSPLIGNPTESYFFFFSVYFFSLQSIFFVISWIKKEYIGGKYFEISYIWKWLWFILHLCLINNMARYRILSWKAFSLRTWRHFSKALYFPVLLLKNSDTWYFIWRLFLISGNFRVSLSPVSEIPWCQILLCSCFLLLSWEFSDLFEFRNSCPQYGVFNLPSLSRNLDKNFKGTL